MFPNHELEPQEILELFSKRPTVIKPGLTRIERALKLIGYPAKNTPKIIVGGTNGKGTTSGMIWRLLAAAGLRVGLFTSPHLIEFRERISISDRDMANAEIVAAIQELRTQLPSDLWEELTFFEINTILACVLFAANKTDVNVFEVGLGGRLDCVNVYDSDVAVITSIGLDHVEFLGNSVEAVAREKSGIMRKHKPCVWGGMIASSKEAHQAVIHAAQQVGAPLLDASLAANVGLPISITHRPRFLQQNFVVACEAVRQLLQAKIVKSLSDVTLEDLVSKFDDRDLPWPVTFVGRFDLVRVSKGEECIQVLVDVCHNPHGARALSQALVETGLVKAQSKRNCLISVLEDKDVAGIWDEIKGNIESTVKFRIDSPRSWKSSDDRINAETYESFLDAWNAVRKNTAWIQNQPWLIFGSVAAVGDVLKSWREDQWTVERIQHLNV